MTQQMTEDNDTRIHRVKCDFGSGDYYKHFLKETGAEHISRIKFSEIIKEFNSHVRDRISTKGAEYTFPNRIGKIVLRKRKTEVKLDEDGNIINNLPINWKSTRELWAESASAKEKKTKIRYTNEHYMRSKANFKNKSIYKIQFNRQLKRQLSKSIFEGRIDAFLR